MMQRLVRRGRTAGWDENRRRAGHVGLARSVGLPFGVLEADSRSTRESGADDVAFLQSAANLLSVAIERQQYEAERDHLLNVVAHELRNPLAVVLGFSERLARLLRTRDGNVQAQVEAGEEILASARRMQRLIDMLLQLGRAQQAPTPGVAPVNVTAVVRRAIGQVGALYPEVGIQESLPARDVVVAGDEDLADMLVLNILDNAAKYSRLRPEVRVSVEQADGRTVVAVRDACGGIAGDELDRLFDRYFRGQSASEIRGLGLGLFVAHRSADAMAWSVDVRNYPGDGCEFRIVMPEPVRAAG